MSFVNKNKKAIDEVIKVIAKEENVSYEEAMIMYNSLSQKKRRKLLSENQKD